jgi:hypothetical protein
MISLALNGFQVSGSATEQGGKQMSSELSEVLTKMMPRQINKAKPLGSSENPIQLVQQGQTFHRYLSIMALALVYGQSARLCKNAVEGR